VNVLRNIIYITVYFRFQITLTSLRHLSLFPNSQITSYSLSPSSRFSVLCPLCRISFLSSDSALMLYYIIFTLLHSIKLQYIQYIILCIILYIYELSSSLTPFLCYSYSFEKRTIESPIVTREEKRTDTALFSGRVTFFFARTKVLNAHDFLYFSCLSDHATPIAFLSFFS